jgi:aryl-alcohol dehydrogenase
VKITAAVTESKGAPFQLQELELGELRPDEVLVEVAAAGICHTDLICRDQWLPVPLPVVLGHEGAGVVREAGPAVTNVAPGDRVGMTFNSCGRCATCLRGRSTYCQDFFGRNFASARPDGTSVLSRGGELVHGHFFGQSSFATHSVASARNVVKLPEDVGFELAAPFGCGIQTGAGAVLNVMRPPAGSSLAVYGTGAVGLSGVMAGVIAGCTTIIGVDLRPGRLELARELGATHVVDAGAADAGEEVRRITRAGADFALETTGVPAVLRAAVDALAPTGECGVIGAPPFGTEVGLDVNNVLAFGRVVRGIVEGDSVPELFIPQLLDLWRLGRFPVDRMMVSYDFDRINDAVRDAEEGRTIKPVLRMGGP